MKAVATDLKAIYGAGTEAEFNLELKALEMGWTLPNDQQVVASPTSPV
jgi:hypothetical protein